MDIVQKTNQLKNQLIEKRDSPDNPIDKKLPVIPPFSGGGVVRLIILGQDPTVKNEKSRGRITSTLNLDKNNAIRTYVNRICLVLRIGIENVYATNVFKYFYTRPPATTMHVLYDHLPENLKLLQEELYDYNNVPLITLGEPVLQLLTHENNKVRDYWDYNPKTRKTNSLFAYVKANDNKLGLDFYPFPHQPSIRKEFYKSTIANYLRFMVTENS